MRISFKSLAFLVLATCMLGTTVSAPDAFAKDIPPSRAGEIVKQRHGGKVINVRTSRTNQKTVHNVKIIQKGRIRSVPVDAKSGKIIK